jgi:PAS domain-containing protein
MPTRGPGLTEKQLLRIADLVPAMVALYNIKTAKYLYVNRAVRSVLGYSSKEFVDGGLGFAVSLVHPEDIKDLLAKNQKALDAANRQPAGDGETIVDFEYRMRHKDAGRRGGADIECVAGYH